MSAFWLGACPFSVWIGRWFFGKDIREYGDGNPGAANVFRAGGHKSGYLAVILDIAKGVPFVVLAHSLFGLPEVTVMGVALIAILGSALSPLLRFRGGKSLAITFGVLLALPQHEILVTFAVFMGLGFLFMEVDANPNPLRTDLLSASSFQLEGGSFNRVNDMPGLGITLDMEFIKEYEKVL